MPGMAERIQALTGRIAFHGGREVIVPDLAQLVETLATASEKNDRVEQIEIVGKGTDGTDYRVLLEPVGIFKEKPPIGYGSLLLERALGEILISAGICSPQQIQQALQEQHRSPVRERLGEVVVRLGLATQQQVRDALMKQVGGPTGS